MQKKKLIIIISVFLFLLLANFYYFGVFKKTCDSKECFSESIQSCSPAKYDNIVLNNIYHYDISRSLGSECKLSVSLEKSAEGTDVETKERVQGKSMKCLIPKIELSKINFNEVNNILQYCTGPLKEGIYEIIIKNMYNVILSNLGEVVSSVQTSLIKKI